MHEVDDRILVTRLREDDMSAFEALYNKYSARLYNSVSMISHDSSLAKDITQTSFYTVWDKRRSLDPDKSFQAYLFVIARNLVYKETRRMILNNRFLDYRRESGAVSFEDHVTDEIDRGYLEGHIARLVDELDDIPRTIFMLKREGNLSNKEIAAQMSLSERSVEAHFYRTIKFLRGKINTCITIFFL